MADELLNVLAKEKYEVIKVKLLNYRLDPFIREMEAKKGEGKGLIFPFARGLRFSALLIYTIREALSGSDLEVNWGQIISEDGSACSGECDIIIHKKGYYTLWDGDGAGNHIMDFKFILNTEAIAVISCKSYLTKSTIESVYCKNMLTFVKKVWLFAECCGPDSIDLIKNESANIGYENFWYLYTWSRTTGETVDSFSGWLDFIAKVKELKNIN